jgi:L-iditol 2-dehydrogenase
MAGPGGVVQLFAPTTPGEPVPLDLGSAFFREVRLESTYSAGPFDTRDALSMLLGGAVRAEGVVTHRLPLAEVGEAFRLARSGEATKVVIEP